MTDITNTNLHAALIDQYVAGVMGKKRYAFTPVYVDDNSGAWGIGIAVENEQGYHPLAGLDFARREDAERYADGLNEHIGLTEAQAINIVVTTMRRRPHW
jgi:hypothetical protein